MKPETVVPLTAEQEKALADHHELSCAINRLGRVSPNSPELAGMKKQVADLHAKIKTFRQDSMDHHIDKLRDKPHHE